jgi:hypothetical protein
MNEIFEIAAKVADPLALGGFIAAAIFLLLQRIVGRLPRPDPETGARLWPAIVHWLFLIATIVMVLGLVAFLVPKFIPAPTPESTAVEPPISLPSAPAPATVSQKFNERIGNDGSCTERNVTKSVDLCLAEGVRVTDWTGTYRSVRNGSASVTRHPDRTNCVRLDMRYSDSGRSLLGDCRGNGWVDYSLTVNGTTAPAR